SAMRAADVGVRPGASGNRLLEAPGLRPRPATGSVAVPEHPGLVSVAPKLVACAYPDLGFLPEYLLGNTLVVTDLAAARQLAAMLPGYRFITLQGELLEPSGVVTVGTHRAEAGVISRKSELRELREQARLLDEALAAAEAALAEQRERLRHLELQEQHAG